jgi:hypothetical protein
MRYICVKSRSDKRHAFVPPCCTPFSLINGCGQTVTKKLSCLQVKMATSMADERMTTDEPGYHHAGTYVCMCACVCVRVCVCVCMCSWRDCFLCSHLVVSNELYVPLEC